ncbi:hypothetical protein G6F22_018085 [Rhizopus arrhizus]|nr:hypothetical protein G6F22_018085 [Rhizopus arrhizus]KAG1187329.1 hypothetical protein G6F35_014470 [Rhizopus arrhizus]
MPRHARDRREPSVRRPSRRCRCARRAHRTGVADQLHLHALVATAATVAALVADEVVGAGRLRKTLAQLFLQRLDVLGVLLVQGDHGRAAFLLAVPGVDLLHMQALAVLVDPVLHPCHFIGHLPIGVGALPHVADEDVLAAITAEHVDLGQLHRHQADQHDQHDAEQAPATMVQRPVQQRGIAALQPGDHAG